jgi:hypothetical protein
MSEIQPYIALIALLLLVLKFLLSTIKQFIAKPLLFSDYLIELLEKHIRLRTAGLLFLGVAVYFYKIELFAELYSKIVVTPFLSHFKKSDTFLFIALYAIVILKAIADCLKARRYSPIYSISIIIFVLSYLFFRFLDDYFILYPSEYILKYADAVVILVIYPTYQFCKKDVKPVLKEFSKAWRYIFKGKGENSSDLPKPSFFYDDMPLDKSESENYPLKELRDRVVDALKKTPANNHAFIIGIEGSWGTGKTSFINRMEYLLVDRDEKRKRLLKQTHIAYSQAKKGGYFLYV